MPSGRVDGRTRQLRLYRTPEQVEQDKDPFVRRHAVKPSHEIHKRTGPDPYRVAWFDLPDLRAMVESAPRCRACSSSIKPSGI